MFLIASAAFPALPAQREPLKPFTVCEILKNPAEFENKAVAVAGRLSSRADGRTIGEEACSPDLKIAHPALKLMFDRSAPRLPGFSVDDLSAKNALKTVKIRTKLRSFRFGTPDYDRWAIVYGKIKIANGSLIYAGDGYVILLADDYQ